MKRLLQLARVQGGEKTITTPLCCIVGNCNIDHHGTTAAHDSHGGRVTPLCGRLWQRQKNYVDSMPGVW
nr:MAG TPA: hypothetical protein [Caudoviricetes sp.]